MSVAANLAVMRKVGEAKTRLGAPDAAEWMACVERDESRLARGEFPAHPPIVSTVSRCQKCGHFFAHEPTTGRVAVCPECA